MKHVEMLRILATKNEANVVIINFGINAEGSINLISQQDKITNERGG